MKNLTESMNLKYGAVEGAWIMKRVNTDLNAYETLAMICAEMDVNLSEVTDKDFSIASDILEDFCESADETTEYTVSVWFD